MAKIMNMDSTLIRGFSRIADFVMLNFLFIVTCLPVFTLGVALSSLYAMLFRISNRAEGRIFKSYFREFKSNFKKGVPLGLLFLGLGALIAVNFRFVYGREISGITGVIIILLGVVSMLYLMMGIYAFALQARFENTLRNTVKNALLMSVRHFPRTLLLLLINAAPPLLMLNYPVIFAYAFPVFLLAGFSLICCLNVRVFNRVFAHYIRKKEEEGEDADIVQ
jgi:uncharacterized membrane protein YesL